MAPGGEFDVEWRLPPALKTIPLVENTLTRAAWRLTIKEVFDRTSHGTVKRLDKFGNDVPRIPNQGHAKFRFKKGTSGE